MKRNLYAALITILVLALCAPAASAAEPGDMAGTWKLVGVETDGMRLVPYVFGLDMTIVLSEDHTAIVLTDGKAPDKPCTWTVLDTRILVFTDGAGSAMVLSPAEGNLVTKQDEMKLIFSKDNTGSAPAGAADANLFTHPAGVYTLAIPDDWIAIDGALAQGLLAMDLDVVENRHFGYADFSGDDRPDGAVIMLFETTRSDGLFRNNINIGVMDLGQDFSTDALLAREDGFNQLMQNMYEGFTTTAPMARETFGKREAVVQSGKYEHGDEKFAVRQAIFTDQGILYTITLFARPEFVAECEPIWFDVVASMEM